MTQHPDDHVAPIFEHALGLPPEDRNDYLKQACKGDAGLHLQISELLLAYQAMPEDFMTRTIHPRSVCADPANATATMTVDETSPVDSGSEKPGNRIGRYKLLQQIGEGGFGTVWMAEQIEPVTRRVALKVLKLGMDTKEVIARFEAERQALAMMDDPNIAKVLDAGATEQGRPFFVMELVKGVSITRYCDEAQLGMRERLELFRAVCGAINHAHQKGVIHRDIKPSNVMVTLHGDQPVVKVIDFGIAKATQSKLTEKTLFTRFEQFIGTPVYMSPEQTALSGLDIDTRSDIYSLGVLLYELLAGKPPFDAGTLASAGYEEMRRIICEKEPPRPSLRLGTMEGEERTTVARARCAAPAKLDKLIGSELDWVVMKAIDKDRSRRYETANGLALDIQRFLDDEPVSASPPHLSYRIRKFARRHRTGFVVGSAIVAILALASTVSLWWGVAAHRAGEEAKRARTTAVLSRDRAETAAKEATRQKAAARNHAYAADLLLSRQALENGSLREARERLEQQRPRNGEDDLRDWEWRHLWQASRSRALFELPPAHPRVLTARYLDNGHSLVTYRDGGHVAYWDLEQRQETRILQEPEGAESLASSSGYLELSADGRWMASVSRHPDESYFVQVSDRRSPSTPPILLAKGVNRPTALAVWTEAGTAQPMVAVFTPQDGYAVIWHVLNRTEVHREALRVSATPLKFYGALAYHRLPGQASGLLAIGGGDGQLRLLAEKSWQPAGNELDLGDNISCLAFSPDGRHLAAGHNFVNPLIKIVDVARPAVVRTLTHHRGFVADVVFSPDGRWLASASGDQTVKLWDTTAWIRCATLLGHENEVWSVDFSPAGDRLISGDKDGRLLVWSTQQVDTPADGSLRLPEGRSDWIDIEPGGKRFVSVIRGEVHLQQPGEDSLLEQLGTNNASAFWIAPDTLLTGKRDAPELCLVRLSNLSEEIFSLGSDSGKILYTYLPASRTVMAATPSSDGTALHLYHWDVDARQVRATCDLSVGAQVVRMLFRSSLRHLFSEDGRRVALRSWRAVHLYDTLDGTLLATFPAEGHGVQGVALSPDGRRLAFANRVRSRIYVMDVETGEQIAALDGHNLVIQNLSFSADGRRLLTAAIGNEAVKLWDTRSWREVARFNPKPGMHLYQPLFLKDGNTLVISEAMIERDVHHVRIWNAPDMETITSREFHTNKPVGVRHE